jgi:hypothetical protein
MRLLVIMMISLLGTVANSADLTIFDVRKPIAMSDKEHPQKDFYINGGTESGLQTGTVVTVVRRLPLYDSYQSRSAGDLTIPVAKVLIIHVQPGLSVARFHSEIGRNDVPILEENFILIGDRLDLSTATRDKKGAANEGDGIAESPKTASAAPAPAEPEKVVAPEPPPTPTQVQITSQKIEPEKQSPKENSPGTASSEGPAIQ